LDPEPGQVAAPDEAARLAYVEEAARLAYVEEVARYFEEAGWPRMAGRLLGALMTADPREQGAADLASLLHASRGSISTMSRLLISVDLVERHTRPGDRREYLRFRDDAWPKVMTDKTRWITDLRRLGERGLRLYDGIDGPARASLAELVDLMEFFEREWPPLLERWLAERRARKGMIGR
jgi:hypothetical protein